jgi:hypothetical protein
MFASLFIAATFAQAPKQPLPLPPGRPLPNIQVVQTPPPPSGRKFTTIFGVRYPINKYGGAVVGPVAPGNAKGYPIEAPHGSVATLIRVKDGTGWAFEVTSPDGKKKLVPTDEPDGLPAMCPTEGSFARMVDCAWSIPDESPLAYRWPNYTEAWSRRFSRVK